MSDATDVRDILARLEDFDGCGFYHAGQYFADLDNCDRLRRRTARSLARLCEEERERKLEKYRIWCDGKCDHCPWCGCLFVTLSDVTAIDGRLFHGFWCAERYTELSQERIEVTDAGRAAIADDDEATLGEVA